MRNAFFDSNGREISGFVWLIAGFICFAAILVISIGLSVQKNRLERRDWSSNPPPVTRPAPVVPQTSTPAPNAPPPAVAAPR